MSMFDRPAPAGDQFQSKDNVGQLLAIEVLSAERNIQTQNGPADAIRANVYVISPAGTVAAEYANTLVFGKVLFSRLVQSVGRTVLGVLTGQPGVQRQGKSIPYDLDDPSDAQEAVAVRAMTSRPQPATQQADPWATQQAPPGWGAPPPQAPPAAQPWGQPTTPPVAPGPPPGWGAPPAQPAPQGPPPGWGPPPTTDPYAGQPQLPTSPEPDLPPWEQAPPAWGQQ